MPSALSIIGAIALIGVGAGVGMEVDRLPPLSFTLPIPIWHPKVDIPFHSLGEQLATAEKAARMAEEARKACVVSLVRQDASILESASLGRAELQRVQSELAASRSQVVHLQKSSGSLRVYVPVGPDRCARWEDAFAHARAALR